jgi:hypothetical protein
MAPSALALASVPFAQHFLHKVQYEEEDAYEDILRSWPPYLESPLAWEGDIFKSEAEYTYVLCPEEKLEVNSALAYFKCQLPNDNKPLLSRWLTFISSGIGWK